MAKLLRKLSLIAVVSAALCNVIGGGINVLIVNIQNEVAGIGNMVPIAVLISGVIALFISLLYSSLSTAMPRAGGEYIYVSRSIGPYIGFIDGFLKWAGSIVALGTVAYMDVSILATMFHYIGLYSIEQFLTSPIGAIFSSLSIIWFFWLINYFGVRKYGYTVVILATLMIVGGAFVMYVGFTHTHMDFINTFGSSIPNVKPNYSIINILYATAILFWAYIGFTSISQSGGEIENPKRNLPKAFIITSILVSLYYFLYSAAFYHAVPWQAVTVAAADMNVPYFIGYLLPGVFAVFITFFVFLALANDVPPMLYTKSRLFYSWARDGIVPKIFEKTNKYKVPHHSLTIVSLFASLIAISCVFSGFFTEVDVVVMSRFLSYMLMSISLIVLPTRNKKIYDGISFLKKRSMQVIVAIISFSFSGLFVTILLYKDIFSGKPLWMLSTVQTIVLIILASLVFFRFVYKMKKEGKDYKEKFKRLPSE